MNTLSFVGLIQNAALLLSLVLVFDVFALRWRAGQNLLSWQRLVTGLIIGVIGITVMLTPWVLVPGLVFDTRSVLLSISGLFFGLVPTLIAMTLTAVLRLFQGGPGVWPGVSTILVTGTLGLIWRRVRRGIPEEIKLPELYLFGLVTHLIMLALMLTLPWEMALHTLRNVTAPVLVIYPVATALLGGLMANRLRREKVVDQIRADEFTFHIVADNTQDWEYWIDGTGQFLYCSPSCHTLTGHTPDEFRRDPALLFHIVHPEDRLRFEQHRNQDETEKPGKLEFRIIRPDGATLWLSHVCTPVFSEDGSFLGTRGSNRDITEHKQAEETLAQERRLLRTVIDNLPDAIYAKDTLGRKTLTNRADLDNIGLPETEVLGKTDAELFPPGAAMRFMTDDQAVIDSGTPMHNREELLTNRNGETFWQLTSKLPLYDANGHVVGLVGIGRNITERKMVEEHLEKFKQIVACTSEGISLLDTTYRYVIVNKAYETFSGKREEELIGVTVAEYLGEAVFHEQIKPQFDRCLNGETIRYQDWFEYPTLGKRFVEVTYYPYIDARGEISGIVANTRDITARKQAEAQREVMLTALRESEAKLKDAQTIAGMGHWELDLTNNRLQWSDTIYEIFEIDREQFDASYETFLATIHPDDRAMVDQRYQSSLQEYNPYEIEHRLLMPDGRIKWVNEICRTEYNAQGKPIRSLGVVQDITARKQVEEALRAEHDLVNRIMETSPACITMVNREGQIAFANSQAEQVLGLSRTEIHQRTYNDPAWRITDYNGDPFPEDKLPFVQVQRTLRPVSDVRHAIEWPDGRRTLLRINAAPMLDESGAFNGIISSVEDITERVRAQEALLQSEQKYRTLFEQMTEGFALHEIITDTDGVPYDYRFLEINPAYEQLTGLTRAQCVGKTLLQVLPDIDHHWIADYGKVALTGQPAFLEDYVPALERYYEVWAYSPHPRQFATLVQDVTERRQQELERAALLEAEHEQRLRAETLSDVTLALASALDLSDVLMEILRQAQRLAPATASNIALVENDALRIVGWRGYTDIIAAQGNGDEQELTGMLQPLSEFPINAELVATGQPYITANTYDDPRWHRHPATTWVRAHISLPLRLGGQVLGILRLDSDQADTFNIQDVERLQPLARAAAIALDNAQLYAQAQRELAERQRSQIALEASERKFREMLENMHLFAVMLNLEGRIIFCNDFGLRLLGMERDTVLGSDWFETFIPPENRDEMHAVFVQHFATGDFASHYENEILTAGGTARALIAWNNMVVRDHDGHIVGVSAIGEDITARRQAERALQASEAWLRSLVDSMDDVIFSLDTEQRHTAVYGQWVERMKMSPENFLGRTARDIFGPEAAHTHEMANRQVLTTGVSTTYEWQANGIHFQTTLSPLHGPEDEVVGLVGVGRDITVLKDYQIQLQTALNAKTLMLSEIHHRIKNNLQVILGLLELQFGAVEDEGTQQMLRESQNRIKAIALIHEQLYRTPGESQVSAQHYFQSLTRYLTQTYDALVHGIVIEESIADLELDIDLVIPCALIMNELIANALKYAFPREWQSPGGAPPTLRIALHHADGHARLEVADNGVGLPEGIELETSTRLGLRLIKMLVRQIEGELHIEQNAGTCIAVTFGLE